MSRRDLVGAFGGTVVLGLLMLADGGHRPTTWGWSSVVLLALVVAGLTRREPLSVGRLETAFVGLLAVLLAWTWLSAAWSLDPDRSVLEGERTLLYLAAMAAVFLLLRPTAAPLLLAGVLASVTLVAVVSLSDHLLSGDRNPSELVAAVPYAESKLAGPIGYGNALGVLCAFGLVLALGFVARLPQASARAACGASIVILACALYLTFGRGPLLALAGGLAATVLLETRRLDFLASMLALAPPAALIVLLAARSEALTTHGSPAGELVEEGRRLALSLVVLAAVGGCAAALLPRAVARFLAGRGRYLSLPAAALLFAVVIFGLLRGGGPVELARSFRTPSPAGQENFNERLVSLSGSGRVEYWRVALRDFSEHPAVGSGAGSYGRFWLRERRNDLPVRDAHSLYLETAAELGPVGLALLVALLSLPLFAGIRARGHPVAPAALGAYVAYLLHAGVDWDWELPAVTLSGLACGAALLLLAREARPLRIHPRVRFASAATAAALAAVAVAGFLGNAAAAASSEAYDAGRWDEAQEEARDAIRWSPWSADARRLLGEAQLAAGDVEAARHSFRTGLERDPGSWQLWFDLALASDGAAQRAAFTEARRLNPRSPEIRDLYTTG